MYGHGDSTTPNRKALGDGCLFYCIKRSDNMKEFAKKFYRSKEWKKCRESYISERRMVDGGLCEICGERTGYIVHHKKALTPANISNPEISLSHGNLQYVCKPCHDKEEGHFIRRKKGNCVFDANGQPIDTRGMME